MSGIIGAGVGFYFKSFGCAVISFIGGTVIDLDHLIDYYSSHPFTLQPARIYAACDSLRLPRLYLVLHSYELLISLWIAICVFSLPVWWTALAAGLTQHVIFDAFTNPLRAPGYFFVYRMSKGFKKELIFREG